MKFCKEKFSSSTILSSICVLFFVILYVKKYYLNGFLLDKNIC
jgi:hypothetical protein